MFYESQPKVSVKLLYDLEMGWITMDTYKKCKIPVPKTKLLLDELSADVFFQKYYIHSSLVESNSMLIILRQRNIWNKFSFYNKTVLSKLIKATLFSIVEEQLQLVSKMFCFIFWKKKTCKTFTNKNCPNNNVC